MPQRTPPVESEIRSLPRVIFANRQPWFSRENQGWRLAKMTLGNERISLSTGGVLWGMGPATASVLNSLKGRLDPVGRDRAASLHIESEILRLLGYRVLS